MKKTRLSRDRFHLSGLLLRGLLCALAISITVVGCGWYGPLNSVRFNGYLSYDDFYRLPPYHSFKTTIVDEEKSAFDYEEYKQREQEIESAWELADQTEQAGDWEKLRLHLRTYLQLSQQSDGYRQARRNSAIDRLDTLQSKASDKARRAYLAARRDYDYLSGVQPPWVGAPDTSVEVAQQLLDAVPNEAGLRDNVQYLHAALLLKESKPGEAAGAFEQLVAMYPHSEKHEAALFMTAVASMKASCSYAGRSGDDAHNYNNFGKPAGAGQSSVTKPCVDANTKAARQAFQHYLSAYPRGRYRTDARGWLAYLHLRSGERAQALAAYYRMLADESDLNSQIQATLSLTYTRHHATETEMAWVETELADEPVVALAYAYHNLYNYALDPGCGTPWDYGDEWRQNQERETRKARSTLERRRIVAFATRLMQHYPGLKVGGAFALRVAQANLELGEDVAARDFAARALKAGLSNTDHKQALWAKGAAEQRLNDYHAAHKTLNTLIAEDNGGELTIGARRFLAMAAEDAGDYDAALEEYIALGYESDVAYFVDVLLTPERLAGFIERHPQHAKRNQLLYALGLRHLRAGRWDEARTALSQVKTDQCDCLAPQKYLYSSYSKAIDPKSDLTPAKGGICAEWVLRDLKTTDNLERLEKKLEQPLGNEAKAEAMYQLASYQYQGGTMLFYNPNAWDGSRHWLLSRLAGKASFRAPNEARLLFDAAQSHDALARSVKIYLEVFRLFPETRAARDALYTAAVCHERLAQMNDYWRGIYDQGLFAGERLVTYTDVKQAYPTYQLPRGTWGWQPMTRTVNDKPAWLPPPKPKPRPPLLARIKTKAEHIWQRALATANEFWEGKVWPVLAGLFYAFCAVTIGYVLLVAFLLNKQRLGRRPTEEVIRLNLQYDPVKTAGGESVVEKLFKDSD